MFCCFLPAYEGVFYEKDADIFNVFYEIRNTFTVTVAIYLCKKPFIQSFLKKYFLSFHSPIFHLKINKQ